MADAYKLSMLDNAYKDTIQRNLKLLESLEHLSKVASAIYGDVLIADICAGNEIEFRVNGDSNSCILLEELVAKCE